MNVKGVQAQTANQIRIEELLFEINRVEKRIQVYKKGFNIWDYLSKGSSLGFTRKKSSKWNHGYNFETWLEDAMDCTLRPILDVEISFLEPMQANVKQGNFMVIDNFLIVKTLGMSLLKNKFLNLMMNNLLNVKIYLLVKINV